MKPLSNFAAVMKRIALAFTVAVFFAVPWTVSAADGKGGSRRLSQAQPIAAPQVSPAKSIAPEPKPLSGELPSPWRTWSDLAGRTIEAAYCSLYGNIVTIQTRAGQTHQLLLTALTPADREFASDYARRLRARAFADDYVKKAAYQIDFLIGSTLVNKGLKFNAPATDEQFVRRLYLDAVGRIPTAEEAGSFLADTAADKRAKLIDRLLYSPGYTMQMYNWLGDMLRVKDTFGKNVPAFTFQDWLKDQVHSDRTWDSLVRAMLTAEGKLCDNGATGFLLYDAEMPLDGVSNLLTTFLGANVACAQCHDHPLADWKQRDFYQMAAFFGASDGVDERAIGQAKRLARGKGAGSAALPRAQVRRIASANAFRLMDTDRQSLTFPKDYKYSDVKPGSPITPALIKWSPADSRNPAYRVDASNPRQLRGEFAKWMTHPDNPRFAANIANRVWKKVFGLAVQEPVSDLDDPSKAGNPALLAHLAQIVKAGGFDLREFQRVLFNSQTYQRAASPSPDLEKGLYLFPGPLVRRMTAEQVWDSFMVISVGPEVDNTLLRRGEDEKLMSLPGNAMTAENFRIVIDRMRDAGIMMGGGGKKKGAGSEKGLVAVYQGAKPQQRHGMILARASELPQPAAETHFLRLFGQSDRMIADTSTTDGSVPQALMLMNGGVGQLVSETNCTAVAAANNANSDDGKVDALYLSFLSRKPNAGERALATAALTTGLGISDVAWTLANTREFLFVQ